MSRVAPIFMGPFYLGLRNPSLYNGSSSTVLQFGEDFGVLFSQKGR